MRFATDFLRNISEDMDRETRQRLVKQSVKSAAKEALHPDLMEVKMKASKELIGGKGELAKWHNLCQEALDIEDDGGRLEFILDEVSSIFEEAGLGDEFEQARSELKPENIVSSPAEIELAIDLWKEYTDSGAGEPSKA